MWAVLLAALLIVSGNIRHLPAHAYDLALQASASSASADGTSGSAAAAAAASAANGAASAASAAASAAGNYKRGMGRTFIVSCHLKLHQSCQAAPHCSHVRHILLRQ